MEFNTVDGFQGREVDILLLSTVRASGSCDETPRVGPSSIGFVADVRRMNVALTRAKLSLWVFGNARTLRTNRTWAALLEDAKQRNLILSARKPYSSIYKFSSANRSSAGNSSTAHLKEDERLKAATECVNTQKTPKHTSERKRKDIVTAPDTVCNGEEVSHSVRNDAIDEKRRARDGSGTKFSVAKEVDSVNIRTNDNKVLKGAMLKLQENQEKADRSLIIGDEDKQIKVARADVGKGNDNDNTRKYSTSTGKVTSRSQKHMRPVSDEVRSKTINHDKLPEVKIGASSSVRKAKEKGELEASNQAETLNDTIKKRKQQREAVDALLSSSLISSKKSDSVMKSSRKRTLSTSITGPHKRRNGKYCFFLRIQYKISLCPLRT